MIKTLYQEHGSKCINLAGITDTDVAGSTNAIHVFPTPS